MLEALQPLHLMEAAGLGFFIVRPGRPALRHQRAQVQRRQHGVTKGGRRLKPCLWLLVRLRDGHCDRPVEITPVAEDSSTGIVINCPVVMRFL